MRTAVVVGVLSLSTLVACFDSDAPPGDPVESKAVRIEYPMWTTPSLDLLFVVDRSPAMQPVRDNVAANLPRFAAVLETSYTSLHVGVVSADLGATGARDTTAAAPIGTGVGACSSTGDAAGFAPPESVGGEFLVDLRLTDGNRLANYTDELATVLAQMATFDSGCAYSQPLEAMRRALVDHPTFRRDNAYLMVVFLTATDDCSFGHATFTNGTLDTTRCVQSPDELVAVADYVDFLKSTSEPSRVAIAAALPCDGAASRMSTLLASFDHSIGMPICQNDLSQLLAFASIKTSLAGPPCLPATLTDTDATRAATQASCSVEMTYGDGRASRVVPSCDAGHAPCWRARPDAMNCPASEGAEPGYAFEIQRELVDTTPFDTIVHADCLVD